MPFLPPSKKFFRMNEKRRSGEGQDRGSRGMNYYVEIGYKDTDTQYNTGNIAHLF